MQFFITGTDTDVGKTMISTWLALHTNNAYFKPIQTGVRHSTDSDFVANNSEVKIFPEIYRYQAALSPDQAAKLEHSEIELAKIKLPTNDNLIIEGAGGVFVPINQQYFMIDLIEHLAAPVIIVARSGLGTINHSLLTIEALRARNIAIAGVILNGNPNRENRDAIEKFGKVHILYEFPALSQVNKRALLNVSFPDNLKELMLGGR